MEVMHLDVHETERAASYQRTRLLGSEFPLLPSISLHIQMYVYMVECTYKKHAHM